MGNFIKKSIETVERHSARPTRPTNDKRKERLYMDASHAMGATQVSEPLTGGTQYRTRSMETLVRAPGQHFYPLVLR